MITSIFLVQRKHHRSGIQFKQTHRKRLNSAERRESLDNVRIKLSQHEQGKAFRFLLATIGIKLDKLDTSISSLANPFIRREPKTPAELEIKALKDEFADLILEILGYSPCDLLEKFDLELTGVSSIEGGKGTLEDNFPSIREITFLVYEKLFCPETHQ